MPTFSKSSAEKLSTCDKRLQDLFNEVVKETSCLVVCGHRNKEDQEKAFNSGMSHQHWPKGQHNSNPSLAVDVCPLPLNWEDEEAFKAFGAKVKKVADCLALSVEWGGDWADTFGGSKDYPHWQVKPNA